MSKIILYNAGRVAQSLTTTNQNNGNSAQPISTANFKDTSNTSHTTLFFSEYTTTLGVSSLLNISLFNDITGYVSADELADFNVSDYTTNEISDITYTRAKSLSINGAIYTITATNNGASDVDVGSIKFTKNLYGTSGGPSVPWTCLVFGYFLDNPVTIGVGETKTFAVNFDCINY